LYDFKFLKIPSISKKTTALLFVSRPYLHLSCKDFSLVHIPVPCRLYKLYKEFERQLKGKGIKISVEKGLEVLITIFGIRLKLPSGEEKRMLLDKTLEQKSILERFK